MVKLYLMNISEAALLPKDFCIKRFPHRVERAERFRAEDDGLRCLAGGALIAAVLGAEESDIALGKCGKPYLLSRQKFFSLSHSGKYALLAAGDADLGADIEAKNVCSDAISLRVFTEEERSWASESPCKRFSELWTMKESVIKLDGRGLSVGMRKFSVLGLLNGETTEYGGTPIFGCSLFRDGYCISVCSREKAISPPLVKLTARDILNMCI